MSGEIKYKKDGSVDKRSLPRVNATTSPDPTPAPVADESGNMPNQTSVSDMSTPVLKNADLSVEGVRVVHFVEDGFTAFGRVFYRGEELALDPNSVEFQDTLNKDGASWMDMDEDAQYAKWGIRYFRQGPWRGLGYDAAEFDLGTFKTDDVSTITPTQAELAQIEKQRRETALAPGVAKHVQEQGVRRQANPPLLPSAR